jgi:hypothetical protein
MVEFFFSQLVQLVQSRSGLRRSDVQYKVGLCMIKHREVEVYIAQLFTAEGPNYVPVESCLCVTHSLLCGHEFSYVLWLLSGFFLLRMMRGSNDPNSELTADALFV